jgi:hypothetical protein
MKNKFSQDEINLLILECEIIGGISTTYIPDEIDEYE